MGVLEITDLKKKKVCVLIVCFPYLFNQKIIIEHLDSRMWKTNALCCGRMENEMSLPGGNMSSGRGPETGKGGDAARPLSLRFQEKV